MTFPIISKKKLEEHGLDDWGFPSLEFNPHAPQVPGAPGLLYEPEGTVAEDRSFRKRVFTRLDKEKWIYVGMYMFAAAESLTLQEFAEQPAKVRCLFRTVRSH